MKSWLKTNVAFDKSLLQRSSTTTSCFFLFCFNCEEFISSQPSYTFGSLNVVQWLYKNVMN